MMKQKRQKATKLTNKGTYKINLKRQWLSPSCSCSIIMMMDALALCLFITQSSNNRAFLFFYFISSSKLLLLLSLSPLSSSLLKTIEPFPLFPVFRSTQHGFRWFCLRPYQRHADPCSKRTTAISC